MKPFQKTLKSMPRSLNLKNVHKVNRCFILPFENTFYSYKHCFSLLSKMEMPEYIMLGNRKFFLILQCYTKKIYKTFKKKKKERKKLTKAKTTQLGVH